MSPLVILIASALAAGPVSSSADRADTRWHRNLVGPATRAPAPQAARAYLQARAATLGLTQVDLAPASRVVRFRGHRVVRFAQRHEGLPVFGRGVVVRVDPQGRVGTVAVTVAERLTVIPLALVGPAEALEVARDYWGAVSFGHPSALLGIRDDGGEGELVWRVEGNLVDGRVLGLVDAITGELLHAAPLARHALGRVYAANPVATPEPILVELANLAEDATTLTGRAATVYRYVSGGLGDPEHLVFEQRATDDGSGFLYEPVLDGVAYDDPFAEVNLYYHVDRIDAYFREVHGHLPARSVTVVANYTESPGVPYNNAFSTQLSEEEHGLFFGQGSAVDFAYDGDVVYHEYTHFVVDEVSQMGYLDALFDELGMHFGPGGIHEGLADYFSASVTDDGVTGEYSLQSHARPLENDMRCPDDVVGEPHDDGRIIGGVTWEIRETLGASDLADALVFGALTLLSSLASFQDFAVALTDTAELLVGEGAMTAAQRDQVAGILAARGLDRCGRVLDVVRGVETVTQPFGFDWVARQFNNDCETIRVLGIWVPGAFQYRVDVPSDARTLRVQVRHAPGERLLYRVLLRRDAPVGFSVSPVVQGFSVVFARYFDQDFGEFSDADHTVTLTTEDAVPLVPGSSYYIALLHQNCPDTQLTLRVTTSTNLPEPDGGVDPTDDGKSGCGCAQPVGGGRPGSLPLELVWLLGIMGWLSRRRRR